MFKKTIKFQNFNGDEVERDFYFHLSKAELLEMAATDELSKRLQKIIEDKNGKEVIEEFRQIIAMSCGVRSEDGERFIKSPEAQSMLLDSPAYDVLLMELCTEANAAVDFVNLLIPQKMRDEMKKQVEKAGTSGDAPPREDTRPAWLREQRAPTPEELQSASREELQLAFKMKFENNS